MMCPTRLLVVLLLFGTSGAGAASPSVVPADRGDLSQEALIEAGKQIYLHGRLPSGDIISAKVQEDVELHGSQFACANCHRRSGIGSSEGGDPIPPVIGTSLFSPRIAGVHEQYPSGVMYNETRPAYTTGTLGRALREGIDAAGRELSPLMPRFNLTDSEVLAISAYLSTLTVVLPPGISEREIHFATISTPGNDTGRKAMLDVFTTFFHDKNAGTRSETRRAQHAPYHREWMYGSYRVWKLHVWDLHGPEQTWAAQLQSHYARQPVFAVLGGVGSGNWQPIHRFCEEQELPCLLPQIALPPAEADRDFYSVYFSRGVELEAQALAGILAVSERKSQPIVQVLRNTSAARAAAQTLRHELEEEVKITLTDIELESDQPPSSDFWTMLAREHGDAAWVLWLKNEDLKNLAPNSVIQAAKPAAIYLSATLQKNIVTLQQHPLHDRFTLLSPYQLPGNENNTFRFRTWARLRKLPITDLHVQSSSFLAATMIGETLMHMRGNFSREYLIERIEHMVDNMINPSLYPRLSLAPGQRFVAKGCYVWEMGKRFDTAQWVVP